MGTRILQEANGNHRPQHCFRVGGLLGILEPIATPRGRFAPPTLAGASPQMHSTQNGTPRVNQQNIIINAQLLMGQVKQKMPQL